MNMDVKNNKNGYMFTLQESNYILNSRVLMYYKRGHI